MCRSLFCCTASCGIAATDGEDCGHSAFALLDRTFIWAHHLRRNHNPRERVMQMIETIVDKLSAARHARVVGEMYGYA